MTNRPHQRTCIHGRASPDTHTKLRLFAESAGYCQNPNCKLRLFSDKCNVNFHFAEVAHIIAAGDLGPRAKPEPPPDQRNVYSNLILLCPNCHTIIDKATTIYPSRLLSQWKSAHVEGVRSIFRVSFDSRSDARAKIEPLLTKNRRIHEIHGPDREYRFNPEAEEAEVWKRKVISQIIPNNYEILRILDSNHRLLYEDERATLEEFRQHVDDLSERHIGDSNSVARRFPEGMNDMLE